MARTTLLLLAVLTCLLMTPTLARRKKKGGAGFCKLHSTYLTPFKRGKDKVYKSLGTAMHTCEKDKGCGAVAVDATPYKKEVDGPVIHKDIIYLVSAIDLKTKSKQGGYRYTLYTKGNCGRARSSYRKGEQM